MDEEMFVLFLTVGDVLCLSQRSYMSSEITHPTSSNATRTIYPEEASSRLKDTLYTSLKNGENVIIEAQTGLGKTHTTATSPWRDLPEITGWKPIIHISGTRKTRDEAAEMSRSADLKCKVVKNRMELCPVARGDHDEDLSPVNGSPVSEWITHKCDTEQVYFKNVHEHLHERLGGLPCDGSCEAIRSWDTLTKTDGDSPRYDIIHTTSRFLHIPKLVEDANIIFDEQPNYSVNFDQENIRRTANQLFREYAERTVSDQYHWEQLMIAVQEQDQEILDAFRSILDDHNFRNPWYQIGPEVNRLTDTILRAISVARPVEEGFCVGRVDRCSVVIDDLNTIKSIWDVPDLSSARCVIGLDGHPSPQRWKLETGVDFTVRNVLTESENKWWRRNRRQLHVIQIGDQSNSLTGGWRGNAEASAEAIIKSIYEKHGDDFKTCICPKSVETDVLQIMERTGIQNPETLSFGAVRSRNDFKGEQVGLVLGRIDLGTANVMAMSSLLDLDVQVLPYEERNHTDEPFVGPDSERAVELWNSVRQSETLQAVGRYARAVRDPEDSATVYVWTNVLPSEWIDQSVSKVTGHVTETIQEIEQTVRESTDPVTKKMIAEKVGVSGPYAWKILNRMYDQGITSISRGTGPYGADEFEFLSGTLGPEVQLEPKE